MGKLILNRTTTLTIKWVYFHLIILDAGKVTVITNRMLATTKLTEKYKNDNFYSIKYTIIKNTILIETKQDYIPTYNIQLMHYSKLRHLFSCILLWTILALLSFFHLLFWRGRWGGVGEWPHGLPNIHIYTQISSSMAFTEYQSFPNRKHHFMLSFTISWNKLTG